VRAALALALLVLAALLTKPALGQLGSVPPSPIRLEATPLLGPNTPTADGFFTCAVRVHNTAAAPLEGTIELASVVPGDTTKHVTRAGFAVPGQGAVSLQLPARGSYSAPPSLTVRALAADGAVLVEVEVATPHLRDPLLFDLSVPSRVAPALRGAAVAVDGSSHYRGSSGPPLLSVSTPQINPATGDPLLADRAAGYASVTVILARSEKLALLAGAELDALGSWLLSGGALAVVMSRPEDLRGPWLRALVGGAVETAKAPAALKAPSTFFVASDPSAGSSSGPSPGPSYVPPGYSRIQRRVAAPSSAIAEQLVGYRGGNLRDSRWGASASYGLGEVHLLAFDATVEPFASDPWVKLELLDLVRHAWQRRETVAMPHAQRALDAPQMDHIRRQLDPNEGTRWTIAVAALLLLLYAVLAGPVNFYLAARKGKPLRALLHLPIYAGLTMLLIVLIGVLAKGLQGRSRRLTVIEAGAGMPRAAATRFRGFYASSADRLTVRASERSSVLDIGGDVRETTRWMVVDRDGARLERFRAKPWQTVVVREDGFISLGGGVSLVAGAGGEVEIKNRSARDLIAAVLKAPGKDAVIFSRIKDGELVSAKAGEPLPSVIGKGFAGKSRHSLGVTHFAARLDAIASGLSPAWQALETLCDDTDFWPDDVPVLIAQLDGGEGKLSDSGLRVDVDRVLVRVIGWGGVP
jgi:hypothetical protein